MPWAIRKRGRKYQVYNPKTGQVKGSHDTPAQARAHEKALYANVPESRRKAKPVSKRKRKSERPAPCQKRKP